MLHRRDFIKSIAAAAVAAAVPGVPKAQAAAVEDVITDMIPQMLYCGKNKRKWI